MEKESGSGDSCADAQFDWWLAHKLTNATANMALHNGNNGTTDNTHTLTQTYAHAHMKISRHILSLITLLGSAGDHELERGQHIDGASTDSDKVDHESRDKALENPLETHVETPRSACEGIVFIHRVIDDLMSEFVCSPLQTPR